MGILHATSKKLTHQDKRISITTNMEVIAYSKVSPIRISIYEPHPYVPLCTSVLPEPSLESGVTFKHIYPQQV